MSSALQQGYPRPDFVRHNLNWQSLNGPWDFLFDDDDVGLSELWQQSGLSSHGTPTKIQVPFVFQAKASGIHELEMHEVLWYERSIEDIRTDEERRSRHQLLVRFGAVDYHATVWLDGHYVGEHRGGHVSFDLDVTEALSKQESGPHRLTIRVYDSVSDLTQPRGKQYWKPKPESIFYTPSSGIWQDVFLESVPNARIADSSHGTIIRSHNIENGQLDIRIAMLGRRTRKPFSVQVEASLGGIPVKKSESKGLPKKVDFVRFDLDMRLSDVQLQQLPQELKDQAPLDNESCWRNGVALWSPEYPLLYDLTVRLLGPDEYVLDEVKTTTGMRRINWTTGDGTFRLNGRPYFQALLLDQGYWPDTLMTAPDQNALKRDIELSKAMGFNGCRKHQKVEDSLFMYWADKLGFLVWGEMASCYEFSVDYVDRFDQEWIEMVRRDINHPCVVTWTPVNESWGYPDLANNIRQRDHIRSLYYRTKTLDPTRPINDNCGWEHVLTDLSTFHDYAGAPGMAERCGSVRSVLGRGKAMFLGQIHGPEGLYDEGSRHYRGTPILCTEFGGVNIASACGNDKKENWGYTTAKDSEDLLTRVENIVMATVKSGVVCGAVWTQFTDIEQEQNGLYTFDRREKLPGDKVKAIMERAREIYHSHRT